MRHIGSLLVGLLMAAFVGASSVERNPNENKEWRVALPQYSQDEVTRRKEKAVDGSLSDASELAGMYGVYAAEPQAIFWGMIAAENSGGSEESVVARYNLGFQLRNSPDLLQQQRARFWLKQVAQGKGETANYARNILTEIDQRKYVPVLAPESSEWKRWPKWIGDEVSDKVKRLERRAMTGSAKAAVELQNHHVRHSRYAEAVFWGMIAAENDPISCDKSCLVLAELLARTSDSLNQRRAHFWLKRVIVRGGKYAKDANRILEQLTQGTIKHDINGSYGDAPIFRIPK